MKMIGKACAEKLFGAKYERLPRTLLIDVIVFWGLYIAGFQVQIAQSVRILMISAFTAGVMWQAVSSGRSGCVRLEADRDRGNAALYDSCSSYGCSRLFSEKILVCGRHLDCRHSGCHFIMWKQAVGYPVAACKCPVRRPDFVEG